MSVEKTIFGPIFQMGYLVENLEISARSWALKLGVGPFVIMDHVSYREHVYRDAPIDADISLAFAYNGETQIELIQQHDEGPSVFRDFKQRYGFGLQHVGAWTHDMKVATANLSSKGISPVQRGVNSGGTLTVFFDTASHVGSMFELIEVNKNVCTFFSDLKETAANWDGTEPLRRR